MRWPRRRNGGTPLDLKVAQTIPGSAGLFPIQGNSKGSEHDIVQIAHIGQILHVSSLFTEFIDGTNQIIIGGFVLVWRLLVAAWYVPLTIYRLIVGY